MNLSKKPLLLVLGLAITIFLFFYLGQIFCNKNNRDHHQTAVEIYQQEHAMQDAKIDYAKLILAIDTEIEDLTSESDLFRSKTFIYLYENPVDLSQDAIELIGEKKYTNHQKVIAARTMSRLPLDTFADFISQLWQLYKRELISIELFEQLAFPSYDWNTSMAEHYKDPKIRQLLLEISASAKISRITKSFIDKDILTGKAKNNIVELREAGQIK